MNRRLQVSVFERLAVRGTGLRGAPWEGRGQPGAEVNTASKRPGEEGSQSQSLPDTSDEC